jgi:hypothetical protein
MSHASLGYERGGGFAQDDPRRVTATAIAYLTFTRHMVWADSSFGGWLMRIEPPMASASTGARPLPYAPAGRPALTCLCCYAVFGLSLVASDDRDHPYLVPPGRPQHRRGPYGPDPMDRPRPARPVDHAAHPPRRHRPPGRPRR